MLLLLLLLVPPLLLLLLLLLLLPLPWPWLLLPLLPLLLLLLLQLRLHAAHAAVQCQWVWIRWVQPSEQRHTLWAGPTQAQMQLHCLKEQDQGWQGCRKQPEHHQQGQLKAQGCWALPARQLQERGRRHRAAWYSP